MSTTDYVVDILLIVVIFRQLRERPYTLRTAILPIGIMVWAGYHYLRGFDIAGNDLVLITLLALSGLALGAASGATTFMWLDERSGVLGRVGFYACLTWIIGMGFTLCIRRLREFIRGRRQGRRVLPRSRHLREPGLDDRPRRHGVCRGASTSRDPAGAARSAPCGWREHQHVARRGCARPASARKTRCSPADSPLNPPRPQRAHSIGASGNAGRRAPPPPYADAEERRFPGLQRHARMRRQRHVHSRANAELRLSAPTLLEPKPAIEPERV